MGTQQGFRIYDCGKILDVNASPFYTWIQKISIPTSREVVGTFKGREASQSKIIIRKVGTKPGISRGIKGSNGKSLMVNFWNNIQVIHCLELYFF